MNRRLTPLGRALDTLEYAEQLIAVRCPAISDTTIAGDARRFEPLVSALVLVATTTDPAAAVAELSRAPEFGGVVREEASGIVLALEHAEVCVLPATGEDHGAVLFAATGAPLHVESVRTRQVRAAHGAGESEVYAASDLPWIPPELRHATGEIEAAVRGELPSLIERRHLRGDLHLHSTYSDGQDSLEMMVSAAEALGYEYIAITDHSEGAAASRTLSRETLPHQQEEVCRLRERFPQIVILHGVEVDILPDGTLDFPDSLLESFDIVLASLHESAGHDGETLTRRCIQAIHHPLVNVITHPANRLVGRREGYPLDFEAIYAAAAESGTALEIDGGPGHLDLDGARARQAIAAGVTVTIDSDSHRAAALDRQMRLGLGTARRGWVEPRHVLNARSVEQVRAFVRAKRTGRSKPSV